MEADTELRHGADGRRRLPDERQREHAAQRARLDRHPELAPELAQELLLVYYQRFAADRRDVPWLRKELAKAYFRVGQITKEIGSHQQAIEALRSAQSIWEPLVKADPKQHELEGYLAESDLAIGRLQIAASNLEDATNSLTRARAMLERLEVEYPLETRYQSILAAC